MNKIQLDNGNGFVYYERHKETTRLDNTFIFKRKILTMPLIACKFSETINGVEVNNPERLSLLF